ncbi:type IV pili twitching motility protein PilT [bacterium (Candidatus Gribaldobacteria) CG_4_10_14_0_2_um_filter_41_16]|uniref:Type IV pili twitching motility protein PilT n=3 Tax=Candidatus Gribaldobacteria TaxID=2798536 RepID=A0A2M7VJ52_9BACT|nr:MAG: type IV pili twitching motility protein PilT [bacterium (Candidatus Gribaldobacteria) CG02_land_8_20_14_3_00_41_15]PIX03316.1 MAG: type IV pili twitching motility protein PilT [bacterium (Candidatus Gribaldobacteria) CG_4_8_14_3_um_filter_42_11]PJA01776.1 MAG: type IV pili twitching motility protein PilT [bacterium (Candidatus Gribaldobacteria) CG_4_10_14_0_2_um_filter_41_16]
MDFHKEIRRLLGIAIQNGASDLHLSAGYPPILRITKRLIEAEGEKELTAMESEGLAMELMTEIQRDKFLREKEADFAYELEEGVRFRVNVFWQRGYCSAALRIISSEIKTIDDLNLPPILHQFASVKQGFVLITGPTSQGKSTTLAAIIDEINHQRSEHIITIEDPVEYLFKKDKCLINQREVYRDTLSFARALKSSLREDPNVIMVGEMRDLETISTSITAAETGHLVFSTLHTNSASQSIHRLIDVFPAHQQNQIRAQLAAVLLGVVSQRLVPRIDQGFVPACEIMFNNAAVANLIRENKVHEISSIIETSGQFGMNSLNKHLADLAASNIISPDAALKYSLSPEELKARLQRFNHQSQ